MKNYICPHCNTTIKLTNRNSKSIHNKSCEELKSIVNKISKEYLKIEYLDKGQSSLQISENLKIGNSHVIKKLKEFLIPIRNCKQASNSSQVKKKRVDTTVKIYGVKNVLSNGSNIRKTMEVDLIDKYGVSNVFMVEAVKDKINKTLIAKYGGQGAASKIIAEKMKITMQCKYGVDYGIHRIPRITTIHKKILDLLTEMGISHQYEITINKYRVDILVDKKIIEINGDFFHASPLKFKPTDILNIFGTKITAKAIWDKEKERSSALINLGYDILVLWETEINSNITNCKDKIWKYLK